MFFLIPLEVLEGNCGDIRGLQRVTSSQDFYNFFPISLEERDMYLVFYKYNEIV